jgi:hypothetical protein
MNPNERPNIDNDSASEPAHPAPAQSPRTLVEDGLPRQHDVTDEREQGDRAREESERAKKD